MAAERAPSAGFLGTWRHMAARGGAWRQMRRGGGGQGEGAVRPARAKGSRATSSGHLHPRLQLQPPGVQHRLGIARGLLAPLEHQITGRLKGDAVKVRGHRHIGRVGRILPVDDRRHLAHRLHRLRVAHHLVVQPVGDVLAGNAAGGAIFHQTDVMDVGHLGTAHALFNPAHDIAKDALRVVLDLGDLLRIGPAPIGGQRNVQERGEVSPPAFSRA